MADEAAEEAAAQRLELEELTELWPDNPTVIMVKSLPEPTGEGPSFGWNATVSKLTE